MTDLLAEAKQALQAKENVRAWQLLQQASQQHPNDYRVWLWMASIAPTPQESLRYIQRAETLQPNHPTIQRARQWAERKLGDVDPVPAASKRTNWLLPLVTALTLLVILFAGSMWWRSLQEATAVNTPVTNAIAAPETNQIAQAVPQNTPEPSPTALPPTQVPATTTPQQLVSKKAVSQNVIRATWTSTPLPTPTPSPTPTPMPTYINPNQSNVIGRPWGVGADERWVDVDLTRQLLTAYEGDTLVYQTYISSGTWEHPTVTGQFRVWLRYESQTMNGRLLGYDYYLENVPFVMYFYEDYALHGAYWHNNFGNPMSHGCVNLHPDDAQWLFYWTSMGTLVNVHH